MNLTLNRCWLTQKTTMGRLLIEDVFFCYTLEDRYRPPPEPKVRGQTCIPVGRYELKLTYSPRFKVIMPLLLGVPDFVGVRIHTGNTEGDTEGCILVGLDRDGEKLKEGTSRPAYNVLFRLLTAAQGRAEPIFIDVRLSPHEGSCS